MSFQINSFLSLSGKFQMIVLKGCGHVVHEDSPGKVGVA